MAVAPPVPRPIEREYPRGPAGARPWGLLAAIAALLVFLFVVGPPEPTHVWDAIWDAGHVPLFGTLALLLRALLASGGAGASFRAFGLTVSLGAMTELAQTLQPSREPSIADAVNDAAGAAALLVGAEARALGLRQAARRCGAFVLRLLPGLVLGYAVMGLLWPWGVAAPLNPLRALEYFSVFFEKPWREVFAGQLIWVPDMPASYLPTLLVLQLPEIMLALAAAGTLLAGWLALRGPLPPRRRANALLLVAAAFAPILLAIATRPAMYNGFRHFLFLLPPFAVLGGIAGAWLWQRAARHGRSALLAAAAVGAVGLASPVVEMVRLHPYEYTHFNHIEGGVAAAENRFMLDYWGLSFKQAAQELRERLVERMETPPEGRRWRVAVCGPHPPAAVELGPEFEPTWDIAKADFALMLGVYYCMQLNAPILARVDREGVNYARAYDVRERSFSTLFTVPHL